VGVVFAAKAASFSLINAGSGFHCQHSVQLLFLFCGRGSGNASAGSVADNTIVATVVAVLLMLVIGLVVLVDAADAGV
jgi:hypothetical protein